MQNKVIENDILERMFQKAILVTALSFILSNFGPIDDWSDICYLTYISYCFNMKIVGKQNSFIDFILLEIRIE